MGDLVNRHVVVTGGKGALGTAVVGLLQAEGATVHLPAVNLTVENDVVAFYAGLPELWGSVHLVGGFAVGAVADTSLADFRAMHDLNAVTCFLSCREAVKAMRRGGGGGRIVNVAARPALVPTPGMIGYVASKAVVASLTANLAAELVGENIFVNAVAPSLMDTAPNRAAMPNADHGKWPKTDEVAQAIAFLVSPKNALTSGAVVPVYGRA